MHPLVFFYCARIKDVYPNALNQFTSYFLAMPMVVNMKQWLHSACFFSCH